MSPKQRERRYVVSRVSDNRIGDFDFFDNLHAEMDLGGSEAMLYDMLHKDLGDWHPRKGIPRNKAYMEQSLRAMGPLDQWLFHRLSEGKLGGYGSDLALWPKDKIPKSDVLDDFKVFCRERNIKWSSSGRSMPDAIGRYLAEVMTKDRMKSVRLRVPNESRREWYYVLPALEDSRILFENSLGVSNIEWPEVDGDDVSC